MGLEPEIRTRIRPIEMFCVNITMIERLPRDPGRQYARQNSGKADAFCVLLDDQSKTPRRKAGNFPKATLFPLRSHLRMIFATAVLLSLLAGTAHSAQASVPKVSVQSKKQCCPECVRRENTKTVFTKLYRGLKAINPFSETETEENCKLCDEPTGQVNEITCHTTYERCKYCV